MDLVWAWAAGLQAGRIYARAAGMRYYHHHNLPGTAINWENHHVPPMAAFDVELPPGSLSPVAVRRHVHAVFVLGKALS